MACSLKNDMLIVVNEVGELCIFNKNNLNAMKKWIAHMKIIFDVSWRNNDEVVTVSGDQSIAFWNIETGSLINKYEKAHKASIKSVSFDDNNRFSTGARDGVIKIWDCRSSGPVINIEEAHLSRLPTKLSPKNKHLNRTNPSSSVTCVLFHPSNQTLYSSGANDATIKIWDLRKCKRTYRATNGQTTPLKLLNYYGKTTGKSNISSHGFTSLVFDKNHNLYASCSDHNIYGYLGTNNEIVKYTGHRVSNFTKIKVLDNYLISGSVNDRETEEADNYAYVWPINRSQNGKVVVPTCVLPHSKYEVTAIECDPIWMTVYTCCDDQTISRWSVHNNFDKASRKAEPFNKQINASELTFDGIQIKRETPVQVKTPGHSKPFTLITNWLNNSAKSCSEAETGQDHGVKRKSNSTGKKTIKKQMKENKLSKRRLFVNNRKISDYFSNEVIND